MKRKIKVTIEIDGQQVTREYFADLESEDVNFNDEIADMANTIETVEEESEFDINYWQEVNA